MLIGVDFLQIGNDFPLCFQLGVLRFVLVRSKFK